LLDAGAADIASALRAFLVSKAQLIQERDILIRELRAMR
jgi:hypothetical protein